MKSQRRQFRLSPLGLAQLSGYCALTVAGRPVFVQAVSVPDNETITVINIHGIGDIEDLQDCAEACEKEALYLPVPNNKRSKHPPLSIGEAFDLTLNLYAVGIWPVTYGIKYQYRMQDENGNEYIWTTDKKYKPGVYRFKGKVKGQVTYNGVKQTAINYCKEVKQ